ncbi:Uncharacterised protein [Chlamydia trachomatis]|nr:Uncharacterised protein [Chlamydia trachomatis]
MTTPISSEQLAGDRAVHTGLNDRGFTLVEGVVFTLLGRVGKLLDFGDGFSTHSGNLQRGLTFAEDVRETIKFAEPDTGVCENLVSSLTGRGDFGLRAINVKDDRRAVGNNGHFRTQFGTIRSQRNRGRTVDGVQDAVNAVGG